MMYLLRYFRPEDYGWNLFFCHLVLFDLVKTSRNSCKVENHLLIWICKIVFQFYSLHNNPLLWVVLYNIHNSQGLREHFIANQAEWKQIYDSQQPQDATLPAPWDAKLDEFQKLCVLRCIRFDKVVPGIQNFVICKLIIESSLGGQRIHSGHLVFSHSLGEESALAHLPAQVYLLYNVCMNFLNCNVMS